MIWKYVSCLSMYYVVVSCGAYAGDILVSADYETQDLEVLGEYFKIRRCQSVEFPVSHYQTINLNDFLLLHCSCFAGQYAPICPQWFLTNGEEYVNIEEAQIDLTSNFCKSSLVIGANSAMIGNRQNVSVRCVIPYSGWNVPDFTFKIEGSKFTYSYVVTHQPFLTYGILCWMGVVLLFVVHKSFCRSHKRKFQLYAVPEVNQSLRSPVVNKSEKSFMEPCYNVLIQIKDEKTDDIDKKPLLDNTKTKEIM